METRRRTLVIGGTGKTGRRVATRLRAHGTPTRVASRTGTPAFDWNAPDGWAAVLHDVDAIYLAYHPDLAVPGAAEQVGALARQAVASGTERIVLLSGRGEDGVLASEEAVRTSGAAVTILRSAFFCQNFSEGFLADGVREGLLEFPAGEVPEPFVDADDIADVAFAALTGEGHAGRIYELTGPRLLTFGQAVEELARATGRPVRYASIPGDEYARRLSAFLPEEVALFLRDLFAEVLDGRNAHVANGVEEALGRPARDFRRYAEEFAIASWRPA